MVRRHSKFRAAALCGLLVYSLGPGAALATDGPGEASPSWVAPLRTGGTDDLAGSDPQLLGGSFVFSTYPGIAPGPWTVLSQRLLGGFIDPPDNTTEFRGIGADDFTVTGDGWRIDEVEVRGTYFNGAGPAESMSVYFLPDAGGAPSSIDLAAAAIRAYEDISYDDIDFGDPRIPLVDADGDPDPLFLPPGTYWIVVQANMSIFAAGQWGWTESADGADSGNTFGAESHWFQNFPAVTGNDGVQNCILAWGPRVTECQLTRPSDPTTPERDFAFRLAGEALVAEVAIDTTAIETAEPSTGATFNVSLTAPPREAVDVPMGAAPPGQATVSETMLSFDASNWQDPQAVTVQPVDDVLPEATTVFDLVAGPTSSADANFDALAVPTVTVTQLDDDQAGVSAGIVGQLSLAEDGGQGILTFNLTAPLAAGETLSLPLSVVPAGSATVPASVDFTSADGTGIRQVQVTAIDDDIAQGDRMLRIETGDVSSTNPVYDALTGADVADVLGTLIDDDTAGFTVQVAGGEPATTTEAGGSATFSVRLTSEPLADVTLDIFSADPTEAEVDADTVVFTPGNWSTPQTFEVTGLDELFDDGDTAYSVVLGPADSADPGYLNRDPQDVPAINLDDDVASFLVDPVVGLTTGEDGSEASFTVMLTAEPQFPVQPLILPLAVGDGSEGEISSDGMTFAESLDLSFDDTNWDQPVTIHVRGLDDPLNDGDVTYLVETGDPTAGDPVYDALAAADVADVEVVNVDDERITDVPTLGEWGAALLALLLAGAALVRMRS